MATNHQKVLSNLETLDLLKMKEYYPHYLDSVASQEISLTDALFDLTEKQITYQKELTDKRAIKLARFPTMKTLEEFDFEFQPSINKQEVLQLQSFHFLESYTNICFLGNSGVGKTHLATAIGIESCVQGIKTKFILFSDLIDKLTRASQKGTLIRTLKMFANIPLLIIDEIGYTPIDKQQADWFYQLMSRRYEQTSTVITTNIPFSMWAKSFNNTTASAAILDRLIHHSKVFKITGKSYRLKDYHLDKENDKTD